MHRAVAVVMLAGGCASQGAPAAQEPAGPVASSEAPPKPRRPVHRVGEVRNHVVRPGPTAATVRFGQGYPPPIPTASAGRVGSLTWGTWIQPKRDSRSLPLGSIRPGSSIPLASDERVRGLGRCHTFVRVEHGYVCVGSRSTLDMRSAWMRAGRWTTPAPGPFPYEYALSVGAPMLTRVPGEAESRWTRTGDRSIPRMRGWAAGHDELAQEEPIVPSGPIPDFLTDGGHAPTPWTDSPHIFFKKIPLGSMLAYTRAFEANGHTWVLSTNMTIVPAQGLKRFRRSRFRGIELQDGLDLPVAWIRKRPRPKWRRVGSGFERDGGTWPVRGWVALTGREERWDERTFLETRDAGSFIEASDADIVRRREKGVPWEVRRGLSPNAKWIHVQIRARSLTLYEGDRPVFTTLISPGKQWATPFGRFFIESKHHVTTMTTEQGEPRKFWIADVPWTQYFKRPYAIHGAYWHEDFGEEKSGGCVNLSPIDAKRVFDWTDPKLPRGWGSVQGYPMGGGTFVLVEG